MDEKYKGALLDVGIDPAEADAFAKESGSVINCIRVLHKTNRAGQFEVQIDFFDNHTDFRSFMVGDLLKHILHCRRVPKIPVYDQESDQ